MRRRRTLYSVTAHGRGGSVLHRTGISADRFVYLWIVQVESWPPAGLRRVFTRPAASLGRRRFGDKEASAGGSLCTAAGVCSEIPSEYVSRFVRRCLAANAAAGFGSGSQQRARQIDGSLQRRTESAPESQLCLA